MHKLLAAVAVLSMLSGCAITQRCNERCAAIAGPVIVGLAVGILAASAHHGHANAPTWALRAAPGPEVRP